MKVIIIGAGLAGLGAGRELNNNGIDFQILEAEEEVGGLVRTDRKDSFYFDYTGHFLHIKSKEGLTDLVESTVPFEKIRRKSAVLTNQLTIPYPLQYNMRFFDSRIIKDVLQEIEINQSQVVENSETLSEFIKGHFGETLLNLFFKPYNEKLWGVPLTSLPKNCLGNYFPKIDLDLLMQSCKSEVAYTGYNDFFFYPASGKIGDLPEALALPIQDSIKCSRKVEYIDPVKKVCYDNVGGEYSYDFLISSLPLPALSNAMNGCSFRMPRYNYTSIKNVRVAFKGELLHEYHWVYIPDMEVPFYRIGFPQNVNVKTTTTGYSTISIEVNTNYDNLPHEQLAHLAMDYLAKYKLLLCEEIVFVGEELISPAYTYQSNDVNERLAAEFTGFCHDHQIYSVGRYGLWKYLSMEEAYLSGKSVVREKILKMIG